MDGAGVGRAAPAAGREGRRRGVGSLLGAYYGLDGASQRSQPAPEAASTEKDLDNTDFDAKRYFDKIVSKEQIPKLLKSANALDSEVRDLDGDMNMIVYENYSKFLRSMDCTRGVRTAVDGLEPDLKQLEGSFQRITEHQRKVDESVSGRSRQIEALLKQQRVCKKLRVLFELPATLRRCLDAQAYGKASEAYCCCVPFLRQYKHIESFKAVLDEVDLQMGRVRSALERRLHSAGLGVEEAMSSSLTLLELGQDRSEVAKQYLGGRTSVLQQALEECFEGTSDDASAPSGFPPLEAACRKVNSEYIPGLVETVEGLHKLQGCVSEGNAGGGEDLPVDFVRARIEALFARISRLVEKRMPSSQILVESISSLREALRKLHAMMPQLLMKLFTAFLNRVASDAVRSVFACAAGDVLLELKGFHSDCKSLQDVQADAGLSGVPEGATNVEQAIASRAAAALQSLRPILGLVGSDAVACKHLVRSAYEHFAGFFLAFAEGCRAYTTQDGVNIRDSMGAGFARLPRLAQSQLQEMATLEWVGLFGLSLVWLGRRLEAEVVGKAWAASKDVFAAGHAVEQAALGPAIAKSARDASEQVLTHYVMVSGQRLAYFFRNAAKSGRWNVTVEPKEPSLVVEMLLKEGRTFETLLAHFLGDPRKARGGAHQRRLFKTGRNSAEMEVDRLMAKNIQVFATVPLNRSAAVVGILRIAFKAFGEYVREETFGKFGLQQIQVDCAMLADVGRSFVEEADEATSLEYCLSQVVNSATQRCTEPCLVEENAVDLLCDSKRRAWRLD